MVDEVLECSLARPPDCGGVRGARVADAENAAEAFVRPHTRAIVPAAAA